MCPSPRRSLLSVPAALLLARRSTAAKRPPPQLSHETEKTTFVNLIGSLHNPYDSWWAKGGELSAAAFKLPYILLQSEGNFSANGLNLLSQTISKTGGNMVLNLYGPSARELQELADLCASHHIYFVTQDNLPPAELRPWVLTSYYVAHIDFDERLAGLRTGRQLIAAMGGQGASLLLAEKPIILLIPGVSPGCGQLFRARRIVICWRRLRMRNGKRLLLMT